MRKFIELFSSLKVLHRARSMLYNLNEFHETLNRISGEQIAIEDDILIDPFYIDKQGRRLELYDYELNIRLRDKSIDIEKIILSKTGKTNLEDVDPWIQTKLQNCYIELVKPENSLSVQALINYINFVKSSSELRERISEYLHEFDEKNYFFAVY